MKNVIRILCLCLALTLAFGLTAGAAGGQEGVAAAYVQGQTLQVFCADAGREEPLKLNGRPAQSTALLAEAGSRVTYVLVVDRSQSTRSYLNAILELVDALDAGTPGCGFRLCGFSSDFTADATEYDAAALKSAIRQLSFTGRTDIHYGISQAVQKLTESQWAVGELYNLILLTDGWSDGTQSERPAFSRPLPFLFHTCVLGGGGSAEELALLEELCNGIFSGTGDGGAAGRAIAGQVSGLTAYTFPLEASDADPYTLFSVQEGAPEIVKLSGVHVAGEPYAPEAGGEQPDGGGQTLPPAPTATPVASPDNSPEASPEASAAPGPTPAPSAQASPEATSGAGDGSSADVSAPAGGAPLWPTVLIVALLAVIAVLLAALLAMTRLRRKKAGPALPAGTVRPSAPASPPHLPATRPQPGTIPMKLEVLSGKTRTKADDFYLKDWLLIGSDPSCDLVFDEPEVAGRNSRIFFEEGYLYIEDLASPAGTALGGMRLYAPNRLRSGDEISIGDVLFRFTF